jgi:hypothetical protein
MDLTFVLLHNRLAYTNIVGAFVKLRIATASFIMTICPSVRMEQLRLPWMDFHENNICVYFSKIYRKPSSFINIWQE